MKNISRCLNFQSSFTFVYSGYCLLIQGEYTLFYKNSVFLAEAEYSNITFLTESEAQIFLGIFLEFHTHSQFKIHTLDIV